MHRGLAPCNLAGAASSSPRVHLTGGENLSYYIDGDDMIQNGYAFSISQDKNGSANYQTIDLPKQVKSEVLEGQEQSAMTMSNVTSASGEASVSSGNRGDGGGSTVQGSTATTGQPAKKKRNLPGTPDPDAEVIALSPKTLMATNRFVCEICNKGFQRDQNLQLHRRGHNLPWKLKQRTSKEIRKRVYICPEPSCVHHDPTRALGDLTGIKKHFCRKHGEKKWKCEKCSKKYAVQSDWKAHSKTCGTREYRCDCGTLFSRRDSFITHRAFCDALAEENARISAGGPGSQQLPGNHSNNTTLPASQPGGPMSMMGPSSSPGRSAMIRLGGNTMDHLSSTALRTVLPAGASKMCLSENGLSSLPPRWEQANGPGCGTPGTRPRLNLWLGTGPGPGPPGNEHLIGGPQQLQAGGSSFPNPLNVNSAQNGAAVAGLLGPSDYEGQKSLPGLMPFGSSSSGNTHYGNFFVAAGSLPGMSGSSFGQNGGMAGVGMSGFADLGGATNWTSATGSLSLSSSARLGSSPASSNVNNAGGLSSVFNQNSAQMSATALLQKAAQMGATASNPSLLRGFGMACPDSSNSGVLGSAWPGLGPDQEGRGGMASMVSTFMQSHPQMRSSGDLPSGSSFSSANFGGIRTTENGSLHELMSSLSGSAGLFANFPPFIGDSGSLEGMIQFQRNGPMQNRQTSQQASHGGSQPPFMGASVLAGLGNLPRAEDGASDRLTRDFLGVGGPSGMAGAAKSAGGTLSQRDLATITSLGSGMDMSPFSNQRDDLRSMGVSSQSSGKSWET